MNNKNQENPLVVNIYSVKNSTRATQRFSANDKTSSEQKNQSSFISDKSQMRHGKKLFISINDKATKYFTERHHKTKMNQTQIHLPNDGWPD